MTGRAVRWGVLSTAAINDLILDSVAESERVRFVAVASRDGARAERYAQERGIERAYGGYEALLADPDVEAVYVSLPNALHAQWTLRALEAGKHVLCEKPFTARPQDAQAVADASRRYGRLAGEAFMYRYHAQTRVAIEHVRSGAIGRLRLIQATLTWTIPDPAQDVRVSPDLDGGALMDVGCYCVSAARLIAGDEPEQAYGELIREPGGVDQVFAGTLRFPGGVLAQFDAAIVLPRRDRLELVGTEGSLVLSDPWHCREPAFLLRRPEGIEPVEVPAGDAYRLQMETFSAAIAGERELSFGADDLVGQARAIDALMTSAAEGRPISLSRPTASARS